MTKGVAERQDGGDRWAPVAAWGEPRHCVSPRRAPPWWSPTSTWIAQKDTVALIESAGGKAVAEQCDVAEDADVAGIISSAIGHFGRLDIMFNNVGIPTPRLGMAFEDHTLEDFERLNSVNVRGVFLGCRHAVIRFKEQGDGGVILNTGSVAGLVGWGGTVYGATKGAVHQLPAPSRSRWLLSGSGSMRFAPPGCPTPASWRRAE